jgi:hypothetical protein
MLVACGGSDAPASGSGVDPTLAIGTISNAQITDICEYAVSLSREVTCNGNPTQSVAVQDSCEGLLASIADGCIATVADMEVCFEDLSELSDDEVCMLVNPDSCLFLGDASCIDV